ncbi:MAG TPA: ATP-dependent DNA helicase RecG [Candidatus Borkfalkia stercoripullorum]|nr:ATP-dependent DNA helicase RecG [Candidatus Borkfalkia stercoripullorum]
MELSKLKGVTEKRLKELNKMGIFTPEDLVRFFPRAYLDLTHRVKLSSCYHNDMALVACRVASPPQTVYTGRRNFIKVWCDQDGELFSVVWFNAPYVKTKLKEGEYLFYGRVQNKYGNVSMVNPTFEPLDKNYRLKGIVPVYSLKGSLTQRALRDMAASALKACLPQTVIPPKIVQKYGLTSLSQAYLDIHNPPSEAAKDAAAERIALEEYFVLVSAFKYIKGGKDDARTRRYACTAEDVKSFASRFAFEFTGGQKKAVNDVFEDLKGPTRMNRLLQGDVGSGKTAVALCALYMAAKSGYQAAFVAPTEVLAEQNFRLVQKVMPEYGSVFLSGSATAKEKKEIKQKLASGEAVIACGTHAVIQSDVVFKDLALCVCDEQHRFGVAQRNALGEKGEGADMLVMSATPIPRTLSLIFYGDLDISEIKDKPKARAEIVTAIIPYRRYDDMLEYIGQEAKKGNQSYFVCPKIEGDEEGSLMSVTELFDELKNRLPRVRFALLHGKMKDKEKAEIMSAFKQKKYDCLVSTTVIEVGIDVPDATIMVIYNAERFGLSQLHQLRGRVGRGSKKSYCFLLCGSDGEEARERLSVIKQNSDGFRIAEYDLKMRGGGDFLGTRQSGKFLNEIRNLKYPPEVIFEAKKLSDEAFEAGGSEQLRAFALKKYESLKEVILN